MIRNKMPHDQFRHPYPEPEALDRVLNDLPHGVAVSVRQIPPYWDVCVRRKTSRPYGTGREYFVTEGSSDTKPVRVSDVWATEAPALAFAHTRWATWFSTKVSMPEWPWE